MEILTDSKTETVHEQQCLKCGHRWLPRNFKEPRRCPKCKSIRFDEPPEHEDSMTEEARVSNG